MLITISGTPGTGKTYVAKILAKKLSAKLITTDYLTKKYKIKTSLDKKRKTKIIDVKKLSSAAKKESNGKVIFEGHLSHFAASSITIILRTSPTELRKRLRKKGWPDSKVRENVEAEAIGVISNESKRAIEINTTRKKPNEVAILIFNILNNYHLRKKYEKKIDWSKEYETYLKKYH